MTHTVAALFVSESGPYINRSNIDAWTISRDARTYPGPLPVIAHPPCERWGSHWHGTTAQRRHKYTLGDDHGCFAAAIAAVRAWGGVIEHPARSLAWMYHGFSFPHHDGWTPCDSPWTGWWTCAVYQGSYGHRTLKPTWLLYNGRQPPHPLDFERPSKQLKTLSQISKVERDRTPYLFMVELIRLATVAAKGNQ